jgi:hypothetical protein
MGIENTGIVEENIHTPESAHSFIDSAAAFIGSADICAQENGLPPVFQDLCGHCMTALFVTARDRYSRSFFGE